MPLNWKEQVMKEKFQTEIMHMFKITDEQWLTLITRQRHCGEWRMFKY